MKTSNKSLDESQFTTECDYHENGNLLSKTKWFHPTELQLNQIDARNIIVDRVTKKPKIRVGHSFVFHKNGGVKHEFLYNDYGVQIFNASFRADGTRIIYTN